MKACFFTMLTLVAAAVVARKLGIVTDIPIVDQAVLTLIRSVRLW
jgi:hypothetical protein